MQWLPILDTTAVHPGHDVAHRGHSHEPAPPRVSENLPSSWASFTALPAFGYGHRQI
jgi:hypothetical protein